MPDAAALKRKPVAGHSSTGQDATLIRVLIVDDSVVVRAMLARMLAEHPSFVVAAQTDRAERAIEWLAHNRADIVLLDIEMPDRDGLAALPDIIAAGHGARIVMVSSLTAQGAETTLRALALGAADAVVKPGHGALGRHFADNLINRLLRLGPVNHRTASLVVSDLAVRDLAHGPVACVAIGASTGGLHALTDFFAALPPAFDAPILVTQHLPAAFISFFAGQLTTMSRRPCVVARDGGVMRNGSVYVAPGEAHLVLERRHGSVATRHRSGVVVNRSLPSVDPMFESVAALFGDEAVGVVLSGMGRDGTDGAGLLAACAADVLVQDAASAVVWGMPGAVARAGFASLIAPPAQLARHIAQRGSKR